MAYQFREIRMHDIADALAFADELGLSIKPAELCHNLSLLVKQDGEIVAAGLCTQPQPGRYALRIALSPGDPDTTDALAHDLADRALSKMQSKGIGALRVTSAVAEQEATLWEQTNWLERIEPVLPPGCEPEAEPVALDDAVAASEHPESAELEFEAIDSDEPVEEITEEPDDELEPADAHDAIADESVDEPAPASAPAPRSAKPQAA